MDFVTSDNLVPQLAGAADSQRPKSTILAATPTPNVVIQSATAPLPLASTNSANRKRAIWREKRIAHIIMLAAQKGSITNRDVRQALRVAQNLTIEYLHELIKKRENASEGKGERIKNRLY